jgi:hypothetical protein
MTYGVDQFVFVTDSQQMYYNTTGIPQLAQDQLLVSASAGLLTYFSESPVNTLEGTTDCYDGAFMNNTVSLGSGGPYNG